MSYESQVHKKPIKAPYFEVACKYCGSRNVIRYGSFRGVQRFFCKDCQRKWADNDALPQMQTPVEQVGAAIGMYYEGQSLNSIRRLLTQIYGSYPSDSTVYRWVTRFTKKALAEAEGYTPKAGDTWVADETVLRIDGGNLWFWDIIDSDTRFLLASHVSRTRTAKDAQNLMELAAARAGKTPKVVLTDKLSAYLDGIEFAFGSETKHIPSKPFDAPPGQSTNRIERFHGTLKARTKVMRGLKGIKTARLITDGWLLHYNYFRPHETLGKTPAKAAGLDFPYQDWKDIVANGQKAGFKRAMASEIISLPREALQPTHTRSGFKIVPKKRARARKRSARPAPVLSGVRW